MTKNSKQPSLATGEAVALLKSLELRFAAHSGRHPKLKWNAIEAKLLDQPQALWSLGRMEATGGEPDVVGFDRKSGDYRYGRTFIYHNGAESYYGVRGFRGLLKL